MRIFFSILSIVYVVGIFILADSPMVSDLSRFNPYSLLHVPLYGILTFLLVFSFVPMKIKSTKPLNSTNPTNPTNPPNSTDLTDLTNLTNSTDSTNLTNPTNPITRFLVVGFITLAVAIADEIHQAYVPGRDASITDVLLDVIGIFLVLFLVRHIYKKRILFKSISAKQ